MNISQGSLVIIGANTENCAVYWGGIPVPDVVAVRVEWESDEQRVKLKVRETSPIHGEMALAGINIKRER